MRIIILLLSLFSFGFSHIALAQSGIYVTSLSGFATQNSLPIASNAKAERLERNHLPVLRLMIGYLHDFNENFGLGFEAGGGWYHGTAYYLNDGKKINAYSTTMEFLAVLVWHQEPLDYFIKAGGIRHTLTNFSTLSGNSQVSETKIQPEVAIGINYNFNKHLALTSEYLHSFGNKMENFDELKCPSINAILVGVRIAFW